MLIKNGQPSTRERKCLRMIPIWVYAVVAGIVISAIMAIKTGREERVLELENIEKEGEAFMKRLEEEKETRENQKVMGTE